MERVTKFLGRLQYRKWVLYYRYKQEIGFGPTSLLNLAFGTMFAGMVLDNHSRKQNAAVDGYNHRKENITAAETKLWSEQREKHSLNTTELEDAVFRFRRGEYAPGTVDSSGVPYPFSMSAKVSVEE